MFAVSNPSFFQELWSHILFGFTFKIDPVSGKFSPPPSLPAGSFAWITVIASCLVSMLPPLLSLSFLTTAASMILLSCKSDQVSLQLKNLHSTQSKSHHLWPADKALHAQLSPSSLTSSPVVLLHPWSRHTSLVAISGIIPARFHLGGLCMRRFPRPAELFPRMLLQMDLPGQFPPFLEIFAQMSISQWAHPAPLIYSHNHISHSWSPSPCPMFSFSTTPPTICYNYYS